MFFSPTNEVHGTLRHPKLIHFPRPAGPGEGAHPDWTKKGGDGVPNSPKIVQDLKQTKGRQLVNKATSEDMRMVKNISIKSSTVHSTG